MKSFDQHEPTPEQQPKGEWIAGAKRNPDGTMDYSTAASFKGPEGRKEKSDEEMSRERSAKKLEEKGAKGYLLIQMSRLHTLQRTFGVINGHKIEYMGGDNFSGNVDGIDLSREEVISLYEKYASCVVPFFPEEPSGIADAEESKKQEILKDLGL